MHSGETATSSCSYLSDRLNRGVARVSSNRWGHERPDAPNSLEPTLVIWISGQIRPSYSYTERNGRDRTRVFRFALHSELTHKYRLDLRSG